MLVFDASSIIYAWDNYPVAQFPGLWLWMRANVVGAEVCMSTVAYAEVKHPAPDCTVWLNDSVVTCLPVTNEILLDAMRMKKLLGIVDEKYGSGVGENDLLIIATARASRAILVSEERQPGPPKFPYNSKIPTVCAMQQVQVECITFLEFIKRSGVVF